MGRKQNKYFCQCGETKIENFYAKTKNKCKKCILEKAQNKYENMSDNDKKIYINKSKVWVSDNLIKYRTLAAKHRALKKNIEFDIDVEFITDLLQKQDFRCKYSNELLDLANVGSFENQMNLNSLSIDRKDSNKGYTKDNVVLVTAIVNSMKNDLSENIFLGIIKTICLHNRS